MQQNVRGLLVAFSKKVLPLRTVWLLVVYDWRIRFLSMLCLQDKLSRQTTIADFYSTTTRCERPRLLQQNLPIVFHDNSRCHVAINVTLLLGRR